MLLSLPARGVWVEIGCRFIFDPGEDRSLPARGVWVEIWLYWDLRKGRESLPARGVWVEITNQKKK